MISHFNNEIHNILDEYIQTHITNYFNTFTNSTIDTVKQKLMLESDKILYHNYKYEKDIKKLTPEIKTNLFNYLSSLNFHEPPNLKKICDIVKINDGIRTEQIYINSNDVFLDANDEHFKSKHIGMDFKDLRILERENYFQNMIDEFYKSLNDEITLYDLIKAFKTYITFELIHPFIDGNGRIGRIIFLEHPFNYNMFPFSEILDKLSINQESLLFKYNVLEYNGKDRQKYTIRNYLNWENRLNDNEKKILEMNIYKIIYKVIVYKLFSNINEKYEYRIKAILNTRIENIYDKFRNDKNCYSYDEILTVLCPDIHNDLMTN